MSENSDNSDNASRDETRWRDSVLADARARADADARAPLNVTGLCQDCGEPIAPGRLAFNPRVRRCTSCQQDHDKRARR